MSHSSSQTEIGSIHSQKSQQRELSCPVSPWQITMLILFCDGIWFQPPRFRSPSSSLLINHRRGSTSKHCCVNNPPLSSILNASQSSEGAATRASSPKRAKDTTEQLFWARVQCSSRWGEGTCSPYPLHPVGPLVFIGTDTGRPLRRHRHRHKHTDVHKICPRAQREDWMEQSLKSCLEIYGLLETARAEYGPEGMWSAVAREGL